MLVNIHSTSDVITNSSTEIFSYPCKNAIKSATEILQIIIDSLDIKGKPEDYFDIKLVLNDRGRDFVYETDIADEYNEDELEEMIDNDDPRLLEEMKDKYIDLSICPKKNTSINLARKFFNLFNVEAEYT